MAQNVQLPDGTLFPMKEGETPEQALMAAASLYPSAFAPKPPPEAGPKSGGIAALKSGASELKSDIATLLGRTGAIAPETAEKYIEEQKKYQAKTFKPTETFGEAPLTKFSELLMGSVPYMAAPVAAGAAAAFLPVSAPVAAALGTGAAGLASYGQFTGSFLSRQMDTGKKLGETELGTAALAALPAAALDTISLRMIPGIRGILGAAGKEVTEAQAKAIAQQNLGRTFGDYVAKAGTTAGVEGLTESAQQVLERMQAGLNISDAEARKEYFDSFVGGAVLGGTLAVPGRALERGKLKGIAEEAETRDKAEARKVAAQAQEAERAAEEARKQDPVYMRQAVAESAALEQQKRDLQAQVIRAPKGETLTEEQKQANTVVQAQLKELAPKLTEAAKESNRVKPLLAKVEEEARLAGMSPEDFMLEQTFRAPGIQLPKGGRFETVPEAEEVVPPEPSAVEQYIQQQTKAAQETRLTKRTPEEYMLEETGGGQPAALTIQDRIDSLMVNPVMAAQIVQTRTPMPDLSKQDNKILLGGLELQLKELDRQRAAAGTAATGAAQTRLSTVEAEEQTALEEAERQQAALDAETARERKIAPEILAQRRIAERPAVGVAGLINRLPIERTAPEGSSVMGRTAQDLQGLPLGAEGQPIYTAEDGVPYVYGQAPVSTGQPQRVKGGFRLFNQQGEPQRPSDYNNIQQRIARALARGDIDQDAYNFLRRAEEVLPVYDQKIETARETYTPVGAAGEAGVAPAYRKDVTETEGFLTLLDRQLELIEKGEEGTVTPEVAATRPATYQGFPVTGARAEAAAPTMADLRDIQKNASADPKTLTDTQRRRAESYNRYIEEGKSPAQAAGYAYRDSVAQPEGERVAVAPGEVPKTVRGKESAGRTLGLARPAATAPLSYEQDLEPLLRLAEQTAGAGPIDTAQLPLFEEEEAKLGVAFTTPEEFAAFLRSDEANRMRGELLLANELNDKLTQLPQLEIRVAVLSERLDRLFGLRKEVQSLKELAKNRGTTEMAGRQWEALSKSITKFVVDRMELAGKIEVLTAHKDRLEDILKASKLPAMRVKGQVAPAVATTAKLKQDLSNTLKDLQTAQTALGKMSTTAKRAETMLRVLRAEDRLNEMYMAGGEGAALQVLPDAIIDSARQELTAAVAELEPVQKKAAEQRIAAQVEAGNKRRQQAAVNKAATEKARLDARKEEQRRLEKRFADTVDRQEISATTQAQQDAREMGDPTFTAVELDNLAKDPVQVLGGYRSAITALEAQVNKAQETSKQARMREFDALKAKVTQLEQAYRAAKTADARAALIPQIEAATADYAAKAEKLNAQPLTWKGMASQIKALAFLYNKVDRLEAKIGPNGEFAASVLADRDQFRALLTKEARAEKARVKREQKAAAKKAEAKEAASRVGAPATTGEALTRTEAAQARKAKKTLYSSKGVPSPTGAATSPVKPDQVATGVFPAGESSYALDRVRYDGNLWTDHPDETTASVMYDVLSEVGAKAPGPNNLSSAISRVRQTYRDDIALFEGNLNAAAPIEAKLAVLDKLRIENFTVAKATRPEKVMVARRVERVVSFPTKPASPVGSEALAAKFKTEIATDAPFNGMTFAEAARYGAKRTTSPMVRQLFDRLAEVFVAAPEQFAGKVYATTGPATIEGRLAAGLYAGSTNEILVVAPGVRSGQANKTLLHELTHAATVYALNMSPELNAQVEALRLKVVDWLETPAGKAYFRKHSMGLGKNRQSIYGLKNTKEFLSELFSDREFQKMLTQIPSNKPRKSILTRFVEALAKFFDYPGEAGQSLFAEAVALTDEVFDFTVREIYNTPSIAQVATGDYDVQPLLLQKPKYETENALTDLADRIIAQPKTFKERMGSNLALEAEMNAVDMRAALQESLKRGAKELGDDTLFTQAMYNVRKADQAMPLVYTALSNGPLEFYTDDKGLRGVKSSNENAAPAIFEAVKNVPGRNTEAKFALASTYMIAQRAANKGLSKLDIGALGLKEADLAAAMDAVNADPALKSALEEVRRRYNAFNEGQIKFLADAGMISKADAKAWLKDGDYVPYYRVRADGTAELVFGGEKTLTIGDIRTQPYLAELKGGEDKILPLNESIIRNTMLITRAALTNNATKEIGYAMQEFGKGKGEVDPKTGKPKDSMPIMRGQGPAGKDIIRFNQEPDPKDPKDDGKRWLRINTKNTAMEGIPSELVVKSLEGAHLTLPAFLKIGGIAGDWLRKGVTRMPPYIFRQLIRDPMAASFTGGLNYGPFRAVVMAGTEFLRSSAGRSEGYKKLIEKGLVQSNVFTGDPDDMSAFATQLASGKDGPAIDRLMGLLDRAAIRADAATRLLVHDNAVKNGLSEVEADMMTMESMNFYKRGLSPTVQYANRLIPFMNAQIQGLNVLAKAMRGNMPFEDRQRIQRKFWNNAVMLFGVGIVYAMAMDDDETFKNAKPRDKYTNFFVNLPGVSEAIKVPLPYESGWFFSAAVALVDAMKDEVKGEQQLKALKDIFLSSVPGYSSVFMPQAVKPLLEVFTNKNFFSGQNIESVAMQNRSPEERFNASTTEAAKALGKVLPLSPIQIEHLARGYFGTAPLALMSVASGFMREESKGEAPERRLSETPILGTVFQKKYGGADADTMYAFAKEATQRAASLKEIQKTGDAAAAKEYIANHRTEISMAPVARQFETLLGRLRTQENLVRNRKDLSAEEKRVRLDQLDKIKQDYADKFNALVRKVEAKAS